MALYGMWDSGGRERQVVATRCGARPSIWRRTAHGSASRAESGERISEQAERMQAESLLR